MRISVRFLPGEARERAQGPAYRNDSWVVSSRERGTEI
jgi:hypothetical protein